MFGIPKQLEESGICQEGALLFVQALLALKQLNLKSLAMQAGQKAVAIRRGQKPILQVVSVYTVRD